MKYANKILMTFAFAFLVLLSVGFGSAITAYPDTISTDIEQGNSQTFSITLYNEASLNASANFSLSGNTSDFTMSVPSSRTISNNTNSTLSFAVSPKANALLGIHTFNLNIESDNSTSETITFNIEVTESFLSAFCNGENPAGLEIRNIELSVIEGFGEDDEFWYPGDEVQIEFEVKNDGDWDVEDVEIEFCLYDQEEKECVLDEDDVEIDNSDFNLDKGDKQNVLVIFTLDIDDLNPDVSNYEVFVKAFGKIDDKDANLLDGEDSCVADSEEIEIRNDDDFLILTNIEVLDSVSCGDVSVVYGEVWNIGDKDQEDTYLNVYNKELGIDEDITIGDVDAFDSQKVEISLNIPANAAQKYHMLQVRIYDEDDDLFENEEDEESIFDIPIKVEGGNCIDVTKPTLTARLISDAKVGEDLVVEVTLKNNADKTSSFVISAENYESWASSVAISESLLNINKQSSKTVNVTFNPTKSGQQTFNIQVVYDGKEVSQAVGITIESASQNFFSRAIEKYGALTVWLTTAIVVLVVLIILILLIRLIVSVARR